MITREQLEDEVADGEHDDAYGEYIMDETPIGNGTMLIEAMEGGGYFEGFCEWLYDDMIAGESHEM